jgi:5-methylcytosine-specific restriction endonuclease McrA
MKRKTTEEFIQEAQNLYGNLYDYSKTEYKNTMTKVIVICPTHGEWKVTPDNHIGKNSGCPKCKGFNLTKKEKIELANQIHNNQYDYSLIKSKDIKNTSKYSIKCPEHGEFKQTWNNHYNMKQGCPKCNIAGRKKTLPEGVKNSWSEEYTREYMNNYRKIRRKTDINFKLINDLRTRIGVCIKKYNFEKKDTSIKELGCSIQEYVLYLEQQFDKDMNWDNYGTYWEIDHIYPLSKGGSFHYTNTQPLTIEENRKKGNSIIK